MPLPAIPNRNRCVYYPEPEPDITGYAFLRERLAAIGLIES